MKNKKVAPTLILALMVIFLLLQTGGIFLAFTREGLGTAWRILVVVIPLGFIVAMISVYRERIREINEEDQDDLSQY